MNVKQHLKEHKEAYIAGTVSAVIGLGLGALFMSRPSPQAQQILRQFAWRAEGNQVIVNLVERSTPSKPVHLVGTNLYFDSLSDAARKTGHSLSSISKHINGHVSDLNGDVFEVLQPA